MRYAIILDRVVILFRSLEKYCHINATYRTVARLKTRGQDHEVKYNKPGKYTSVTLGSATPVPDLICQAHATGSDLVVRLSKVIVKVKTFIRNNVILQLHGRPLALSAINLVSYY